MPEYCRCTPADLVPFDEIGLVDYQDAVRVAQVAHHVAAHVVADAAVVPGGPVQQPLHLVRRLVPGRFRERPPVLPRQRRQQPPHVRPGLQPRLYLRKPVCHQREQVIKPCNQHRQIIVVQHTGTLSQVKYNNLLL